MRFLLLQLQLLRIIVIRMLLLILMKFGLMVLCEDSYTLTRTWTATDNCGNTDIQSQVITVQDVTAPVLAGIPADVTVECDAVPAPATPTASDNCDSDVTIDFNEVRTDGLCEDSYTLTRTWTATDNCGNTDIQSQVITVQDVTAPVLAGVPADVTVECDAVPWLARFCDCIEAQ